MHFISVEQISQTLLDCACGWRIHLDRRRPGWYVLGWSLILLNRFHHTMKSLCPRVTVPLRALKRLLFMTKLLTLRNVLFLIRRENKVSICFITGLLWTLLRLLMQGQLTDPSVNTIHQNDRQWRQFNNDNDANASKKLVMLFINSRLCIRLCSSNITDVTLTCFRKQWCKLQVQTTA